MIFALGFLVSGLLALLFLPAFWRRALRLSARRLEMQLPLSMDEIIAERDQIRAESAVELRRMEQRVEALVEDRARDMGEIGRRAAVIAGLDADIARLRTEAADLTARLAAREAELLAAQAEIGALNQETFDLSARLDQRNGQVQADAALEAKLRQDVAAGGESLAALETRLVLLEEEGEDLVGQLHQARLELADKAAQAQKATDDCEFLRRELQDAVARREQTTVALEARLAQVQELEEAQRNEYRARVRIEKEFEGAAQTMTDAQAREAALRQTHERQLAELREAERALAQRVEDLRAQNASLQGALDAARRDQDQRPAGGAGKTGEAGEAGEPMLAPAEAELLRDAISDIGSQVSRLVGALEGQAGDARNGEPIGERVRALQAKAERQVAAG